MNDVPDTPATRVVILGGGFGGIYAALELEKVLARRPDLEVTLVARDNYFLFTPMLHEVAARFEKKVRVALDWTLDLCFAKDFACVTQNLGAARTSVMAAEPPQAGAA